MSGPLIGREDEGPYSSVGHWQRRAERAEAEATRLRADLAASKAATEHARGSAEHWKDEHARAEKRAHDLAVAVQDADGELRACRAARAAVEAGE
jgi:hypothetical protein